MRRPEVSQLLTRVAIFMVIFLVLLFLLAGVSWAGSAEEVTTRRIELLLTGIESYGQLMEFEKVLKGLPGIINVQKRSFAERMARFDAMTSIEPMQLADEVYLHKFDSFQIDISSFMESKLEVMILPTASPLSASDTTLAELQEEIERLYTQLGELDKKLADSIASLSDLISKQAQDIQGLRSASDATRAGLGELQGKLASEVKALQSNIEELQGEIGKLEEGASSLSGRLDALNARLGDVEVELLSVSSELSERMAQLEWVLHGK